DFHVTGVQTCALPISDKELVYTGDYNIIFPADSTATVNITKNKIGLFAPAAGDKLVLDQYSGTILEKEIFKDKPFNERISSSIKIGRASCRERVKRWV